MDPHFVGALTRLLMKDAAKKIVLKVTAIDIISAFVAEFYGQRPSCLIVLENLLPFLKLDCVAEQGDHYKFIKVS